MSAHESDIVAACRLQFAMAVSADTSEGYIYPDDASQYKIGGDVPSGLSVLGPVRRGAKGTITLLDIGAGDGTFLREAARRYPDRIRAIGFTAVDQALHSRDGIGWVHGDFQLPATWQPPETLPPRSVDVAVSTFTFGLFAHPAGALQNAMRLLRPKGNLYIDRLRFLLAPERSEAAAKAITADLRRNQGRYKAQFNYGSHGPDLDKLDATGVHLRPRYLPILGSLQPVIRDDWPAKVIYTV